MLKIFAVLAEPAEVFADLKSKPRWLGPFVFTTFCLVAMSWYKSCLRSHSPQVSLAPLAVAMIFELSVTGLLWLGISAVLYLATSLVARDHEFTFNEVFAVVAHCGMVYILGEIVNFLLVQNEFFNPDSFPVRNRFPVGLDLLVWGREVHPLLAIVLHTINIFTFWYLSIISKGLSIITGLSLLNARAVAGVVWAVGVSFAGAAYYALGGTNVGINFKL